MFKCFRTVFAVAVLTVGTYAAAAEMAGGHPDTYVVKRGDTLWDISARFLKKPWLWPEIWQANPQIQNPHLIYPGDVISLAYLDRVAVQPGPREEAPLNAIPLSDIEPFLKDRRVVDSFEGLPHVAGLDEDRLRSSGGHNIYVRGLDGAQPGQRFTVVRPSARFTDNPRSQDLDFRGRTIRGEVDLWKDITEQTGCPIDREVGDGDTVTVGSCTLAVIAIAGHTPGSICLYYDGGDGKRHLFTGDSLFPGGVGATFGDEAAFRQLIDEVSTKIFGELPDDVVFHPGHGDDGILGNERSHLEEWRERGW